MDPVAVTYTSDIPPVSTKEFLDTHATTECKFTLKCVCDMIRTLSQGYIFRFLIFRLSLFFLVEIFQYETSESRKIFKFHSFLQTLFRVFGLGQKLRLESFKLWLLVLSLGEHLVIVVKNYVKVDIKFFWCCPI